MIKNIIFDLDGVLVDTRNIHFEALNMALRENGFQLITFKEHLKIFDGLPTSRKLEILNKNKIVPKSHNLKIIKLKNYYTNYLIKKNIKYNKKIFNLFYRLSKKYKLAVATNAIRRTLYTCIKNLKIKKYIKVMSSNNDVKNPKPHPEIYQRIMLKLNTIPSETLILEDSHYGRLAAKESGANLMPIDQIKDVKFNTINKAIKIINKSKDLTRGKISWDDERLNIVIPMAGQGKRFVDAGYTFPKPLVEIFNKPMISLVLDCININANYIFIIQKEHQKEYNISSLLNILKPGCKIIETDGLTEGAACSVLLARQYINSKNSLIICNSDQHFIWNSSKSMYKIKKGGVDGAILTFNALHPKWSYVKKNDKGIVIKVAEKEVISKEATVGFYYWKHGSDFVNCAEEMIKKNIRVKNEFYICPVYNQAIEKGKKIITEKVEKMQGLGTPEDLREFIRKSDY